MKCKYLKVNLVADKSGKQGYANCCSRVWPSLEREQFQKLKNPLGLTFLKCQPDDCPYREE
ncbi:MAG: hypothetical protein ACYC5N_04865 [Endomicrobiales bacterium]